MSNARMKATRTNRRRQWQRDRRKNADERAAQPRSLRGWGVGLPVTRLDLAMVRRAIRENWLVPRYAAAAALKDISDLALTSPNPRRVVGAVRVIIAAEDANQRAELAALRASRAAAARASRTQQYAQVVFYQYNPGPTPTRTTQPS
jgi:hypothetical protein